mmetsp:Transcript_2413/g.7731  ORF Transcript_2413/g.7731 Transcript_2413/m.7731 type:complete len:272 (-) Transcript_2413:243-1058(-)
MHEPPAQPQARPARHRWGRFGGMVPRMLVRELFGRRPTTVLPSHRAHHADAGPTTPPPESSPESVADSAAAAVTFGATGFGAPPPAPGRASSSSFLIASCCCAAIASCSCAAIASASATLDANLTSSGATGTPSSGSRTEKPARPSLSGWSGSKPASVAPASASSRIARESLAPSSDSSACTLRATETSESAGAAQSWSGLLNRCICSSSGWRSRACSKIARFCKSTADAASHRPAAPTALPAKKKREPPSARTYTSRLHSLCGSSRHRSW